MLSLRVGAASPASVLGQGGSPVESFGMAKLERLEFKARYLFRRRAQRNAVTWFFGPIYGSGPAQRRRARGLGRAPGLQGCATGGPSPPGGCRRVGRAVDAGAGARVLVRRDPAGAGRIGLARATPGRATGPACGGQAME